MRPWIRRVGIVSSLGTTLRYAENGQREPEQKLQSGRAKTTLLVEVQQSARQNLWWFLFLKYI